MSVLAGWEWALRQRPRLSRRGLRRSVQPGRRPAGLGVAPPVRPPVAACSIGYARRRTTALLLLALVSAVAVAVLLALQAAATGDGVPRQTAVVEVHSGETLWDLAGRVAPQSPPGAVVARIRELNGLRGSTLHPGQPLLVPVQR